MASSNLQRRQIPYLFRMLNDLTKFIMKTIIVQDIYTFEDEIMLPLIDPFEFHVKLFVGLLDKTSLGCALSRSG